MSAPRKELSVLVLTEDGGPNGKRAFETIQALTRRLLRHLDDACETHKIDFQPANDEAREILVASRFTNRRDPRRRRLYQVIAAHPPAALPCVGKRHNLELVQGLPVAEVYEAGKSLAAVLDALFGCEALLHAIERTYQPARAPSPS